MRASRRDVDAEQRLIVPLLQNHRDAVRRLAAFARRLHRAEQRMRHRADRHVDHEHLRPRRAEPERAIGFLDVAIAPRARQVRGRVARAREQHQARGVAAETMQRARARIALANQRQQRVIEESAGRHRRQAARLVDHDDRVVLVRRCRSWWGPAARPTADDATSRSVRRAAWRHRARSDAVDFHFTALDARGPFLLGGMQPRRGQVRKHGLARCVGTDLLPIRPTAIEDHGRRS